MLVTPLGMFMLVKPLQPKKAKLPILSQTLPSANLTLVSLGGYVKTLPRNKCAGIFVTFAPMFAVIPSPFFPALEKTLLLDVKSATAVAL